VKAQRCSLRTVERGAGRDDGRAELVEVAPPAAHQGADHRVDLHKLQIAKVGDRTSCALYTYAIVQLSLELLSPARQAVETVVVIVWA
jgi:hypothetical protein